MNLSKVNLEEIIKQRRAKWKEELEKRRIALKLNRTSYAESAKVGKHPLEVLKTDDAWEHVLHKLSSSPRDLESLRNTSTYFLDLLENKKVEDILFPLVLEVSPFWNMLERTSPNLLPLLRQVCKKWRDSIDRVSIQRLEEKWTYSFPQLRFGFNQEDIHRLDEMITYLSVNPQRKLGVGRSICVDLILTSEPDDPDELDYREMDYHVDESYQLAPSLFNGVRRLLEHCGDGVQHFRFKINLIVHFTLDIPEEVSVSRMFQVLNEWLDLMPNLKSLDLILDWDDGYLSNHVDDLASVVETQIARKSYLAVEQLRIRQYLGWTFSSDFASRCHPYFTSGILSRCCNVKELELHCSGNCIFSSDRVIKLIKPLPLESVKISTSRVESNTLLHFLREIGSKPIMKIDFTFNSSYGQLCSDKVNLNDLFGTLDMFPQLEDVSLALFKYIQDDDLYFASLPNLKRIKISTRECEQDSEFRMMEYLLNMDKLESMTLDLEEEKTDAETHKQLILLSNDKADLNEYLIWDLFPYLKQVEIQNEWLAEQQTVIKIYERRGSTAEFGYFFRKLNSELMHLRFKFKRR